MNAETSTLKSSKSKSRFRFTESFDLHLAREVLGQNPYEDSKRWATIQVNMIQITGECISVRTLRERIQNLLKKFLEKFKSLEERSGIEVPISEMDDLLQQIGELQNEFKKEKKINSGIRDVSESSYEKGFIAREKASCSFLELQNENDVSQDICNQDTYFDFSNEIEVTTDETREETKINSTENIDFIENTGKKENDNNASKQKRKRPLAQANILSPVSKKIRPGIKPNMVQFLGKKNERQYEIRLKELESERRKQELEEKKFELDKQERLHRMQAENKRLAMEDRRLSMQEEVLKEVTLRKCSSDEKLGLTVCYSSGSEVDTFTEVYIRDIAPQSVADRDGRLRQGDQILQVNGKDVANREETESLFAENRKAVTLLVSRCYNRSEEYLDGEPIDAITSPNGKSAAYQNSLIEQLVLQQAEAQQHSPKNDVSPPKVPSHFIPDKLNLTNSLVRSKIDSINQEISQLDFRMQNISFKSDKRKAPQFPHIPPPESDTEHIYETIPEDSVIDGELEPIYSCPYEPGDENMIETWLKVHQEEVWVGAAPNDVDELKDEKKESIKTKSKPPKSNSSGEEHENSSSAYNTGGSSNSNPLTFELAAAQDSKHKNVYRSTLILCPLEEKEDQIKEKETKSTTCESCKRQAAKAKKSKSTSKIVSPSSPTRKAGLSPAHVLSDTMYTNVANLQQTMLLQQQLFRQALVAQGSEVGTARPTTSFTSPSLSQYQFVSGNQGYTTTQTNPEKNGEMKMEWKVKRRPDGTRYIARRPIRNRILRNREIRISEERAGLTTEDDTISELKIGRYWTKEERKKHLEKSRERKQRQEILLASRNIDEIPEENVKSSTRKAANNIDNTAKKHRSTKSRTHKDKDGHDDGTVGQKTPPQTNGKLTGLLSVTTV